jgi:membrane-associated phospholipid phosphatase
MTATRLWAVDKLILAYYAFAVVLLVGWFEQVPGAGDWIVWHILGAALLLYEIKFPNRASFAFRHWYPLPYVAACYREMAVLIPAVRHSDADQWLADLDYRIWGAHPTVWLERLRWPLAVEFLQWVYTLFVPMVLLVAYLLWRKRFYGEFRYYAFLIALGFLASYIGYLAVPARGPRFLLRSFQHVPLQGLWLFNAMQSTLDQLESAHYDCFPSGHTELTILAWWSSRLVSDRLFQAYLVYTIPLIFATVYLRYHYTVDLFAGAALAFLLIAAAPSIFRKLS